MALLYAISGSLVPFIPLPPCMLQTGQALPMLSAPFRWHHQKGRPRSQAHHTDATLRPHVAGANTNGTNAYTASMFALLGSCNATWPRISPSHTETGTAPIGWCSAQVPHSAYCASSGGRAQTLVATARQGSRCA